MYKEEGNSFEFLHIIEISPCNCFKYCAVTVSNFTVHFENFYLHFVNKHAYGSNPFRRRNLDLMLALGLYSIVF